MEIFQLLTQTFSHHLAYFLPNFIFGGRYVTPPFQSVYIKINEFFYKKAPHWSFLKTFAKKGRSCQNHAKKSQKSVKKGCMSAHPIRKIDTFCLQKRRQKLKKDEDFRQSVTDIRFCLQKKQENLQLFVVYLGFLKY
jgi:hypothetical protein